MTDKTSNNNFWSLFGKFATFFGTLWVLTQLYNYYFKNDYELTCKGEYFSFELAPKTKEVLANYAEIAALRKAYNKHFENAPCVDSIETINTTIKELKLKHGIYLPDSYFDLLEVKSEYSYLMNRSNRYSFDDYRSFWTFSIVNNGNKPIEEIILEFPHKGSYKLLSKNDSNRIGDFENQITLGTIKPAQEISVKVWAKNSSYDILEYEREKVRVTHKFGSADIEYSEDAEGIALWYQESESAGSIIFVITLIILFIVFSLGWNYGPKIIENEKKNKLKEFNELLKMSEEAKKESNSSSDE